ncbi:MAG: DinB family protein [candidate division Zixibacteria bacterium]|nr:DinB family protein [candidate division Zixibacteria bacterium]
MNAIQVLQAGRRYLKSLVDDLSESQLTLIPNGYNNNVLWHLGHLVAIQQALHYRRAGLPMYIDDVFMERFDKDSSPRRWNAKPDVGEIMRLLTDLPDRLLADYEAGKFIGPYDGFTTRSGFSLKTVEDAFLFNNFHEGIHTGNVMAMKKALR